MNYRATIVLALATVIQLRVDGSKLNYSREQNIHERSVGKYSSFINNRWEGDDISSENDIAVLKETNSFKSQQDYVCGRAIANKKYKEILLKNQNYQMSISRAKYRPIEIRMPRIIGGDETTPGEFPWTVSVKLNGQPICGGSLIDKNWILTAAHCVVGYNPKNLTVRLGAYRIKDMSEAQTLDIPVNMFIVHKDYSIPRPFSNDIALLKLSDPIEFTDFIIPICLPTEDQVSTATSSFIVNDYTNKFDLDKEAEDSGIVVTTKMSDVDIAKCFNKLGENYLNSIGLNHHVETSNEFIPQHSTTTPSTPSINVIPNGSIMDPLFMSSGDSIDQILSYDKLPYLNQLRPAVQHIESPFGSIFDAIDNFNQNNHKQHSNRIWSRNTDSRKLSRMPLTTNKELLREIQQVGLGPMPSLNLGMDQGNLFTIANDLTHSNSLHINGGTDVGTTRENINVSKRDGVDDHDSNNYSGLSGIVVGWGWVREMDGDDQISNKGHPSITLQKVKLPILRNKVCEDWFQSQAKKITLLPSQFCAGYNSGGKDACRGDSGGPMIMEDNSNSGRYKLIGIVSAGIGCARPSLPGLYTRVASFLPWINAQLVRY